MTLSFGIDGLTSIMGKDGIKKQESDIPSFPQIAFRLNCTR